MLFTARKSWMGTLSAMVSFAFDSSFSRSCCRFVCTPCCFWSDSSSTRSDSLLLSSLVCSSTSSLSSLTSC